MRHHLILLGFSLLASSISVQAQNQTEINRSAGTNLKKADIKLNLIYKKVLSQNATDKKFCSDLTEAQRAWIKFIEFHMKTVFPLKDGENAREVYGSIYAFEFATEKTSIIEQRIKQLESLLTHSP